MEDIIFKVNKYNIFQTYDTLCKEKIRIIFYKKIAPGLAERNKIKQRPELGSWLTLPCLMD